MTEAFWGAWLAIATWELAPLAWLVGLLAIGAVGLLLYRWGMRYLDAEDDS